MVQAPDVWHDVRYMSSERGREFFAQRGSTPQHCGFYPQKANWQAEAYAREGLAPPSLRSRRRPALRASERQPPRR